MAEFRFINACFRRPVDRIPVWIMRQAGRYLPEYRAVRERTDFLTLCKTPELAAEVTLQPIRRLGVDAAILFSDILIPVEPMGIKLEFNPGPLIADPVRDRSRISALQVPDPGRSVPFVLRTIERLRRQLDDQVPLIGFAGSPFTLAAYLVEGRGSKEWTVLKKLMYTDPVSFHLLMSRLTDMTIAYLNAQIDAGAQAIQLFNTWAVILSPDDYEEFALPYDRRVLTSLKGAGQVPRILFGQGSSGLLELMATAGADVVGVDWRIDLAKARERLGDGVAVQGNLDPAVLLAPREVVIERTRRVLRQAGSMPGYIFNLGHGILPETPVENAIAVVETVHGFLPT
jgi:uroporphyrinogen decarboxylase